MKPEKEAKARFRAVVPLKKERLSNVSSFETLVNICQTTRCNIADDRQLNLFPVALRTRNITESVMFREAYTIHEKKFDGHCA
jgi:hypothetical protein